MPISLLIGAMEPQCIISLSVNHSFRNHDIKRLPHRHKHARLEKEENKRKRDKDGDDEGDVEIAGCVVPEDPEQKTLIAELAEEDVGEEFGGDEDDDELDPEMVKEGRREGVEFMKET